MKVYNISSDEYDRRLWEKVEGMSSVQLFESILQCYEEVSELFNNEILEEWEADQKAGDDD